MIFLYFEANRLCARSFYDSRGKSLERYAEAVRAYESSFEISISPSWSRSRQLLTKIP